MSYVTAEARQQLLDEIARAIDEIGIALAALGEAYEELDEQSADRLEEQLFRPMQTAYGRAKKTHGDFAKRHGLPSRAFTPQAPGAASSGVRGFLDTAVDAVEESDATLGDLQDSMMPVEVGDAELRAGLAEVRRLLGALTGNAERFVRTFGR